MQEIDLTEAMGVLAYHICGCADRAQHKRDVAAIIAELENQFPGVPELGDDIEQFMEVARAEHWITLA